MNPPGSGRAEKVLSAIVPFIANYWKVLLPVALALALVVLWAYASSLKSQNQRLAAEAESNRALIIGLSRNLREQRDAVVMREAEIEELDRTYRGRRAEAGAAMRKDKVSSGWADSPLPPSVLDVLRSTD
jgi:hypothetical protein